MTFLLKSIVFLNLPLLQYHEVEDLSLLPHKDMRMRVPSHHGVSTSYLALTL